MAEKYLKRRREDESEESLITPPATPQDLVFNEDNLRSTLDMQEHQEAYLARTANAVILKPKMMRRDEGNIESIVSFALYPRIKWVEGFSGRYAKVVGQIEGYLCTFQGFHPK